MRYSDRVESFHGKAMGVHEKNIIGQKLSVIADMPASS